LLVVNFDQSPRRERGLDASSSCASSGEHIGGGGGGKPTLPRQAEPRRRPRRR
jgi:hypothetical protein